MYVCVCAWGTFTGLDCCFLRLVLCCKEHCHVWVAQTVSSNQVILSWDIQRLFSSAFVILNSHKYNVTPPPHKKISAANAPDHLWTINMPIWWCFVQWIAQILSVAPSGNYNVFRSHFLSVPDYFCCFVWVHVWGNSTQTAPHVITPCSQCLLHPLISAKEVKCQKDNTEFELNQGGGLQRASVHEITGFNVIGNQISKKRPAALFIKKEGLICSDVKNKWSCSALFV